MSDFLDTLAGDAVATFMSQFGEWITYEPWQQPEQRLKAIIERDAASEIVGLKGASSYKHEVMIPRTCAPAGRESINIGKDAVWFHNRIGDKTAVRFVVLKVPQQDEGMWLLAVG